MTSRRPQEGDLDFPSFRGFTADGPVRDAARTMVGLLAFTHDRGLEADLAFAIDDGLDAGELPNLATMLRRFTPKATAAPEVLVILPPLAAYDRLIALAGVELVS